MSLSNLIRRKIEPVGFATATPATFATQEGERGRTVASVATVAVAKSPQEQTAPPAIVGTLEPFDCEAFEERAAICEFDGGLSREEAEAIAWAEDDRRRCAHCLNIRPGGFCKIAVPGGLVSAVKGYRPDQAILQRCAGYRPCPDDPDQRPGRERWPGFIADPLDKAGRMQR